MARCNVCEREILHVRDDFTGATFPVDLEPTRVRGYTLGRPGEGERSPRAHHADVEVYVPHALTCNGNGSDG